MEGLVVGDGVRQEASGSPACRDLEDHWWGVCRGVAGTDSRLRSERAELQGRRDTLLSVWEQRGTILPKEGTEKRELLGWAQAHGRSSALSRTVVSALRSWEATEGSCNGLNVWAPQNSSVEIRTPKVVVSGGGACGMCEVGRAAPTGGLEPL